MYQIKKLVQCLRTGKTKCLVDDKCFTHLPFYPGCFYGHHFIDRKTDTLYNLSGVL